MTLEAHEHGVQCRCDVWTIGEERAGWDERQPRARTVGAMSRAARVVPRVPGHLVAGILSVEPMCPVRGVPRVDTHARLGVLATAASSFRAASLGTLHASFQQPDMQNRPVLCAHLNLTCMDAYCGWIARPCTAPFHLRLRAA